MTPRVLIVGGGLTGLTMAYRLAKSGRAAPVLVERSAHLGGLAGGFQIGGHPIEKAYHHLFRTDRDILALIDELDLGSDLEWLESSLSILRSGHFHRFSSASDLLRFEPLSFPARLRLGLVVYFLQHYRQGVELRSKTAMEWMRKWAGTEAMEVIWEPLLRGKFADYAPEVSMAWLWARIHIRANSREGTGPERLGYLRRGFAAVVDALSEQIRQRGHVIEVEAEVESLAYKDGSWWAKWNKGGGDFSAVVFTGSCPAFLRFADQLAVSLDDETRRRFACVRYLGAACLVFTYPESLTAAYWNNINEPGAPFLVLINHTRLVPRERYGGHHVYYVGAYLPHDHTLLKESEARVRETWWKGLRSYCPSFDPARVGEARLFRFNDAQHVVDRDYAENLPPAQINPNGLFVSNFAQIFPEDRGTNYAVRDGAAMAERVLNFLDAKK